jgi:hypothetical protein
MNTFTCFEIIRPATIMAKILGTCPFTYKNGRLVYSKARLIQICLCFATCILCTVFYFREHKHGVLPKMVTFILMLRSFGWISTLILVLILAVFKFPGLVEVSSSVRQVDSDLISLGQKNRIYKLGLQHRKILIFLLVFEQLVLNILFDLHTVWIRNFKVTTFVGAFMYPRIACTTSYVVFVAFTIIIQKRFEIVNELLDASVNKSNRLAKSSINRLIYLHKILCKTSKELNSIFSLQLLMWFAMCFLLIIWDIHSVTHSLLLEQKEWTVAIIVAKNVSHNVFDLFYLSKRCSDLCYQVNHFVSSKFFTVLISGKFY